MAEWCVKRTIGSFSGERARRDGAREALCFQGRRWTFAALSAGIDRVARGLMALSVQPGDKVALWMVNRPWDFFLAYYARYPQSYRVLVFLQQPGLIQSLAPKTTQEINVRAARNFSLVSRIVADAMAKGIYRAHEPREVVDLLWSLFLGLVHLSETRKNLGVTVSTLEGLHRKAFQWFEKGLRAD